MGVRKKGRAKFEYAGRTFVWWVDNSEWFIRIASDDKSFVVAYLRCGVPDLVGGLLAVHGPEFDGVTAAEPRPIWLVVPEEVSNAVHESMGALVNALLDWCFDSDCVRQRYSRPGLNW